MRELIYAVEGKAANLQTFAVDEPGHGGACHEYEIRDPTVCDDAVPLAYVNFQKGPISDTPDEYDDIGVNGIQNEDLLAILIDRLEGFQSGPYKCDENKAALNFCKCALDALQQRTKKRIALGTEGTHKV